MESTLKWFKHYSDASFDDRINRLEQDYGYEGYGVYWKILEICAMQWDGISEPKFSLNRKKTKSILSLNYTKTESILSLCSVLNLFSVDISEKNYEIFFPKLLEIKDNHTKNLQVPSKLVSSNLPPDKNRTDKNRTEYTPPRSPRPVFDLERVYKSYPRKEGKTAGLKKLTREIKTEDDFKLFEQAVVNYSEHVCINQTEQRYIKHFSSFVSTWRDWIDFSPAKQTNNQLGDGRCALASKVTVNLKTAVARFGRHNYEEVKEFLGDDVKYISLIGRTWLQICETQEKEWGNIQRMLEHVVKK